jgi:predicted nucleotidyltransferase
MLCGEGTPASADVDLLVEFEVGQTSRLLASQSWSSARCWGREVELRTYEDFSRYFRDNIRVPARVLYAA